MGIDGESKMSKSRGNTIGITEDREIIWKKLATAKTDPARVKRSDPGNPDICNLFSYHLLVTEEDQLTEIRTGCTTAGIGCIDCKKILFTNLMKILDPIRQRYEKLESNWERVRAKLDENAAWCRGVAKDTILEAKTQMGIKPVWMA